MSIAPIGNKFVVNTTTESHQQLADIATYDDGSFIIAWQGRNGNIPNSSGERKKFGKEEKA